MKFCPNCGFLLDGKTICTFGYNVERCDEICVL